MKSIAEQSKIIRGLAKQLKELSATQENARKRQSWADHNDLIKIQKPLLWICPDDNGAWYELIPESELLCEHEVLRELELKLRKYIYHSQHFNDDFVFEPKLYLPYPGTYTGVMYGDDKQKTAWGIAVEKQAVSNNAYHLNNYLKTDSDFEKLLTHEVDFTPDEEEKARLSEICENAVDGIVEIEFQMPYSVLVQSHLIELVHLRGLEELMFDLYDNAELLMKVLRHMSESKARLLKKLEDKKLLFDNRTNIYTGSGSLGYTNAPRKAAKDILLTDMWGFADAQEFSNVSPSMFLEYAVENQKIGLSMFGRACYGCCEPMDGKYDAVFKALSNLRRVSVSPWADIDEAAEKLQNKAIFSYKPNPAVICTGFNESEVTELLENLRKKTENCFLEIILKDIRTCNNTPQHLMRFVQLVNKVFGK